MCIYTLLKGKVTEVGRKLTWYKLTCTCKLGYPPVLAHNELDHNLTVAISLFTYFLFNYVLLVMGFT